MLQALKLENAPTPVKIRSENGSDPADSAFAGLMTQASFASMTPAASDPDFPREDRGSARDVAAQRLESPDVQTASKPNEHPSNEQVPSDSDDPAKPAVTAAREDESKSTGTRPEDAPKKVTDPTADQATLKVEAEGTKGQIQVLVPGASSTQIPQGVPGSQAAKPEGQAATAAVRAGAALKGIPQEIQSFVEVPKVPVKPALTELLYLPKGDIQTPKQNPEPAKALQADASKLAITGQAETTGDSKTGTDLPGGDVNQAKPSGNPPGIEEGRLIRPETFTQQIQIQKPPAPSVNTATVPMAEGVKASLTASHVEPARPSPVFTQVEGSIRWILQNKTQGAELQLHPESLGRMVIQLRVEGQEVHARLWASEPTSLAILQDHKAFLESSLRDQGLSLGSFDLHSGPRGDGAQTAPQERAIASASPNLSPLEVKQEVPIEAGLDSAKAHRIEVFA